MTTSDKAVEAAARELYFDRLSEGLETWAEARPACLQAAHKALEAAAPYIKAEAWDEAVASLVYEDGTKVELATNTNPYRSQA